MGEFCREWSYHGKGLLPLGLPCLVLTEPVKKGNIKSKNLKIYFLQSIPHLYILKLIFSLLAKLFLCEFSISILIKLLEYVLGPLKG